MTQQQAIDLVAWCKGIFRTMTAEDEIFWAENLLGFDYFKARQAILKHARMHNDIDRRELFLDLGYDCPIPNVGRYVSDGPWTPEGEQQLKRWAAYMRMGFPSRLSKIRQLSVAELIAQQAAQQSGIPSTQETSK